jgi:transcriptional regulator with XRE-family HTH domain
MQTENLLATLGGACREARKRMHLTQADVAERVGLVPEVYGRLERGHMAPSLQSLRRLCAVLGLSADVLLSLQAAPASPRLAPVAPPSPAESPALRRLHRRIRHLSPRSLRMLSQFASALASSDSRRSRRPSASRRSAR